MSARPLLLACAALLAAVGESHQKETGLTYCTPLLLGEKTNYEPHELKSVKITARDSIVYIPDEVTLPGGNLVGNEVTVCNWAGTGLPMLVPPEEGLSPVAIHMPKGTRFQTLELFVLQYVKPFYGQRG